MQGENTARVYSPADVQELVGYSADRGIRLVPEFDIPGHSELGQGVPLPDSQLPSTNRAGLWPGVQCAGCGVDRVAMHPLRNSG